jgi:hypothetical protein
VMPAPAIKNQRNLVWQRSCAMAYVRHASGFLESACIQAATSRLGTRPNLDRNIPRSEFGMAFRAHHHGIKKVAALPVPVKQRTACTPRHVNVPPMHDRHQDRVQVPAFLSKAVLVARRRRLVRHLFQYVLIDQLAQSVNQHWPGNPQPLLKILKSAYAQETISQDE